jgi:O-acetyl-ADP-ribose deacetylase (regulator of RNase III)
MIRYRDGSLFDAKVDALVNPVNCQGVMGAGLAKEFRNHFPEASNAYMAACHRQALQPGRLHVFDYKPGSVPRWVVHFPTKQSWRHPSRLEWVAWGLERLAATIQRRGIASVALPALGCGRGGLEWLAVREEIIRYLSTLDGVEVLVFPPQIS